MGFPQFNSINFDKTVKAASTSFTGGINLSVLPTDILDSQSPDILNMWYKDGMLRTRPGIRTCTVTDKSKKAVNDALVSRVRNVNSYYIPTIFTDCNSRGGGNQNEDRNMMQPRVKMLFSPSQGDKTFKLADTNIDDDAIVITYQSPKYSSADAPYVISAGAPYAPPYQNPQGNWYQVNVDRTQGLITWHKLNSGTVGDFDNSWEGFTDSADYNVINNLSVEYAKNPYGTLTQIPVWNCSIAQWFGGSLSGLGNGDCLILSGNSLEPNKYYWSAMDDITYWPVNNFNSCGSASEPITALAKQSSYLIAFTANKTYKIEYNATQPSSSSVPYEEFPRSLLHNTIGCDCPDTIELVDNCLTWLASAGRVYRLVTINNTTENAIVPISRNIDKAIKTLTAAQLQAATAVDTGQYYIIFANLSAFAWNYDAETFINYTSSEKSQDRLIWYLWATPIVCTNAFYDSAIYINQGTYYFLESVGSDYSGSFNAYVYTKNFDFSAVAYWKSVYQQCFKVMSDDGLTVMKVIDDYGTTDLSQQFSVLTKPQIIQTYFTSITELYQGYISRPANSTAKFAISEFIAIAQIASKI